MIDKPAEIYDRDAEWRRLYTVWNRARPDLVFAVGRRRIGKSYVLSRFAREVGGLYYQATMRTEPEQLASLGRAVGEHFGDPALRRGVGFPDWEALFEYVTERAGESPFLLVLDEFPYLAGAAPALPSIIQKLWDHRWASTRMKVVLSGSYITAMTRLEEADQPLYGRRTARLAFAPFTFADVGNFFPSHNVRERMIAYALFGNLPGHLALLDDARTLEENVADAFLDPAGRLVDEAQHALDAFRTDAEVHYTIVETIATGEHTWKGITSRVGRSGGSLLRPLHWLEEMQLVSRVVPVTERDPRRSKRALYRIADPYLAFWHRSIAPLVNAGSIGLADPAHLWEEVVRPRLDEHLGPVFEEICREFVRRTNRLGFQPLRVGEWWGADSQNQVDVVAVGGAGELLVGECKWGRVTAAHLATLRARAEQVRAELGTEVTAIQTMVFSGRGEFDDAVHAEAAAGRTLVFTPADLAAPRV
jgi:AAA+ ATPase superfamily predicted ATPase